MKFKNGDIVITRGPYSCIGQICDAKEGFMGTMYDYVVIESELFPKGEIISAFDEFLDLYEGK